MHSISSYQFTLIWLFFLSSLYRGVIASVTNTNAGVIASVTNTNAEVTIMQYGETRVLPAKEANQMTDKRINSQAHVMIRHIMEQVNNHIHDGEKSFIFHQMSISSDDNGEVIWQDKIIWNDISRCETTAKIIVILQEYGYVTELVYEDYYYSSRSSSKQKYYDKCALRISW
jgi:hypothetical protein